MVNVNCSARSVWLWVRFRVGVSAFMTVGGGNWAGGGSALNTPGSVDGIVGNTQGYDLTPPPPPPPRSTPAGSNPLSCNAKEKERTRFLSSGDVVRREG